MTYIIRAFLLALSLLSFQVLAAKPADELKTIQSNLTQYFPTLTIDKIEPSPVPGLYQIMAGGSVIYMSANGRYAISGDVIDLEKQQENLTEGVRKQARMAGLKTLGSKQMIAYPAKDSQYTISIFTDVDCGYCRKLQGDIKKINDLGISVQYLPFPRSGPQSPSAEKMVRIWCAKDKQQALNMASADQAFEGKVCEDHDILKAFQYGLMIGVTGTPSILFEDGTLVPGYLPPEKIKEVAEQIHAQQKTEKAS